MDEKILGVFLTGIVGLIGIIVNQRITIYKQKKEIDDKQNDKIADIDKDIEFVKESLKNLQVLFENLKNDFTDFINKYNFKHNIKNRLEFKSETIIRSNPIFQNNSSLVSLLIAGRNETINFANYIYFNDSELTEKTIEREAHAITDRLKLVANSLFTEKKMIDGWEINYIGFLKSHTKIKQVVFNLISKILDFKKGIYNGQSNSKYVDIFETFLEQIFEICIEGYFNFKDK